MGSKTVNRVGGIGPRIEMIPFYPDSLRTPLDPGHFKFGKVPTARYSENDPDMARLVSVIRVGGPKPIKVWIRGSGPDLQRDTYDGNRTVIATRIVNAEREQEGQPLFAIAAHCRRDLSETQADELFGLANELHVGNDWMTRIRCAAEQVSRGVPVSVAWDAWNFQSQATLVRCLRDENGILQAAPQVQEALARRKIKLLRALAIADIKGWDEQVAALEGRAVKATKQAQSFRRVALEQLQSHMDRNPQLGSLTAVDMIRVLIDPEYVGSQPEAAAEVRRILKETRKPGRKPLQPSLPGTAAAIE